MKWTTVSSKEVAESGRLDAGYHVAKAELSGAAKNAIEVQNASNLSGVVHAFSRDIAKIWDYARAAGKGTDWVNGHPICVLYADKIAHLSGGYFNKPGYLEAFTQVRLLAGDE